MFFICIGLPCSAPVSSFTRNTKVTWLCGFDHPICSSVIPGGPNCPSLKRVIEVLFSARFSLIARRYEEKKAGAYPWSPNREDFQRQLNETMSSLQALE